MLQFTTGAVAGLLATVALASFPAARPVVGATSASVAQVTASLASAAGSFSAASASTLAPWWGCLQGATLEVSGQRVRCFTKGLVTEVVPACGVGHALVVNVSGNRDRCRNVMGGLLDYTCPPQFLPVTTSGQDICRRVASDIHEPPLRKIP